MRFARSVEKSNIISSLMLLILALENIIYCLTAGSYDMYRSDQKHPMVSILNADQKFTQNDDEFFCGSLWQILIYTL